MKLIIALMTCHNRCEKTLTSIHSYFDCDVPEGYSRKLVLVDDGSTDGTSEAVHTAYPSVVIIKYAGNLFWNRGMHAAQANAMKLDAEYLLWLNDDTELHRHSLVSLLDTERSLREKHKRPALVVGSTIDRKTKRITYGGLIAQEVWRPFAYHIVRNQIKPIECHAMNGNVVLIPTEIARVVGNLDPVFEHAMGDIDYALRTRAKGFGVYVAAGYVGYCSNNPIMETYHDQSLPFAMRWKQIMSRKGLPPRSWAHLTRRHGGPAWLIYFAWPYLKLIFSALSKPWSKQRYH